MYKNIPEASQPNDDISLDFADPIQNAYKQKKYPLVSVVKNSGWSYAFFPNSSADKVIACLLEYIATNGFPKRKRTGLVKVFTGHKTEGQFQEDERKNNEPGREYNHRPGQMMKASNDIETRCGYGKRRSEHQCHLTQFGPFGGNL